MDDLISRKAAIDAVENIDCSDGVGISALKCEAVDDGVTAIKALPSAQPEKVDTPTVDTPNCDDTISRQDAIRVASGYCHPANIAKELAKLPSAQPELAKYSPILDSNIGELIDRQAAIKAIEEERFLVDSDYAEGFIAAIDKMEWILKEWLPSAQPDMSEYSDKLWKAAYERGKAEAQPDLDEVYAHAETEAEARYHAQQRWIPCSERLPEERQEILATTTDNAWGDVVIIRTYYKEMHKSVIAWMPLPKPYRAERRTDEGD